MSRTIAVPNSGDAKLGPGWGATYRPVGASCPRDCPLLGNGCYAQRGRVVIHSKRAARARTVDPLRKLDGCGRVRWEVSGDNFKSDGSLDEAYVTAKFAWHRRNQGAISLGYTHGASEFEAAGYGPTRWPAGFNLLASCHSLAEAQELRSRGWRTARVVEDETTELDVCERLCPYDLAKHRGTKPKTNCATCRLCWGPEHQSKSIVFIEF